MDVSSPFTVTDDGHLICVDEGSLSRQDAIDFCQQHSCRIESIAIRSPRNQLDLGILKVFRHSLHTIDLTQTCIREIPPGSFEQWKSLTKINLPSTLEVIGNKAFCKSGLLRIEIPNSIRVIGYRSFSHNPNLHEVTFPAETPSIRMGASAFRCCSSLIEITLPEGLTSIPNQAFFGCQSLTNVHIPDSVREIGTWAFKACKSLEELKLPRCVTTVGQEAFMDCTSLRVIQFLSTIPPAEKEPFLLEAQEVESMNGQPKLQLRDRAFFGCTSLVCITLPASLDRVFGNKVFGKCRSLLRVATVGLDIEGRKDTSRLGGDEDETEEASIFSLILENINSDIAADLYEWDYFPLFDKNGNSREIPEGIPMKLWPRWFNHRDNAKEIRPPEWRRQGEGYFLDGFGDQYKSWWSRMSPLARNSVVYSLLRENVEQISILRDSRRSA